MGVEITEEHQPEVFQLVFSSSLPFPHIIFRHHESRRLLRRRSYPSYNAKFCEADMEGWIDAVIFEFTRVTFQQWLYTIIGGCGLAWLAVLVSWFRRRK